MAQDGVRRQRGFAQQLTYLLNGLVASMELELQQEARKNWLTSYSAQLGFNVSYVSKHFATIYDENFVIENRLNAVSALQ